MRRRKFDYFTDEFVICDLFNFLPKDATEWPDEIILTLRFPAVMRTPMLEHPLRASWRTNLLFPLFPRPGPRDADDMYGGKTPGMQFNVF